MGPRNKCGDDSFGRNAFLMLAPKRYRGARTGCITSRLERFEALRRLRHPHQIDEFGAVAEGIGTLG